MSTNRVRKISVNMDLGQFREKKAASPKQNIQETVMIVDDDVLIAKLFQIFFKRERFTVRVFTNPVEAIRWYGLHHQEVGLIFLDIQMPQLSGPKCLDLIAEIKPSAKVAFVSGGTNQKLIENLLRRPQVHGFFKKPTNYQELADWSTRMLRNGSRSTCSH